MDDDAVKLEDAALVWENVGLSYDWIEEVFGPLELLSVIFVSSFLDLIVDDEDEVDDWSCIGCLIELLLVDSFIRTDESEMLVGGDAPLLIVSVPLIIFYIKCYS